MITPLCNTCKVILLDESAIAAGPCTRCDGTRTCKPTCDCEEERRRLRKRGELISEEGPRSDG